MGGSPPHAPSGGCSCNWGRTQKVRPLFSAKFSGGEPMGALAAQFLVCALFVGLRIVFRQQIAPASIGALVDEGLCAALPQLSAERRAHRGMRLHVIER